MPIKGLLTPNILLFVLVGLASPSYGVASPEHGPWSWKSCLELVALHPPRLLDLFKGSQTAALPESVSGRLKAHPIARFAEESNHGEGLTFRFPMGLNEAGEIGHYEKGEGLASKRLMFYMKALFPKARFKTGLNPATWSYPKNKATGSELLLRPYDHFEREDTASYFSPTSRISLPLMKQADPGFYGFDPVTLKARVLKNPDQSIISLYLRNEDLMLFPMFRKVLNDLLATYPKAVLVVSLGNGFHERPVLRRILRSRFPGLDSYLLSKTSSDLSHSAPFVVFNDTVGNLPAVHAISDLAVVVGPINFFEPLNVGTQTLLYLPEESIQNYSMEGLDQMIRTGGLSGGLEVADTPAQLKALLIEARNKKAKITSPAFVVPPGETRSAFDKMLDEVLTSLKLQLKEQGSRN